MFINDAPSTMQQRLLHVPDSRLLAPSASGRITSERIIRLPKHTILENLDETHQFFFWEDLQYRVHWAYNAIPTQVEWDKKTDDFLIAITLRCFLLEQQFFTAIFDFDLPSTRIYASNYRRGVDKE